MRRTTTPLELEQSLSDAEHDHDFLQSESRILVIAVGEKIDVSRAALARFPQSAGDPWMISSSEPHEVPGPEATSCAFVFTGLELIGEPEICAAVRQQWQDVRS